MPIIRSLLRFSRSFPLSPWFLTFDLFFDEFALFVFYLMFLVSRALSLAAINQRTVHTTQLSLGSWFISTFLSNSICRWQRTLISTLFPFQSAFSFVVARCCVYGSSSTCRLVLFFCLALSSFLFLYMLAYANANIKSVCSTAAYSRVHDDII